VADSRAVVDNPAAPVGSRAAAALAGILVAAVALVDNPAVAAAVDN
jgi:hypothetical protein